MTIVTFGSIKGSPGATTLACLVGATWPPERRVVLAECDPGGGDLASRFGLSSRSGWVTLAAAARRSDPEGGIDPHLQALPGGLEVLVGPRQGDPLSTATSARPFRSEAVRAVLGAGTSADVLVDVGRFPADLDDLGVWLTEAAVVCIVTRADAASIIHVHERTEAVQKRTGGRAALVLVGSGPYGSAEVERFTGMKVLVEVPDDPVAAAVATDGRGSMRRLARSGLVAASRRLSITLAGGVFGRRPDEDGPARPNGLTPGVSVPVRQMDACRNTTSEEQLAANSKSCATVSGHDVR